MERRDDDSLLDDPILKDLPESEGFRVLDRCVLYSRLGQGGMGAVYRGRHLNLDIDVAVKCLKPGLDDPEGQFVVRFQREARVAAGITSENLVRVFDVDEHAGIHYLVMEYVGGETARQRVKRKGPLDVGEATTIALGAARGLAAAHARGVVHRDVKPDNILISREGEVKLADLGLARATDALDSLQTASGMVMGTPRYMPPEQFEDAKGVGPAGDIWALGAVLYFLLTGEDGIRHGSLPEVMRRVVVEGFPSLDAATRGLPQELEDLVDRCTLADPSARLQDAEAFVEELQGFRAQLDQETVIADSKAGAEIESHMVSPPPAETLARIKIDVDEKTRVMSRAPSSALAETQVSDSGGGAGRSRLPLAIIALLILAVGGYFGARAAGLFGSQDEAPDDDEGPSAEEAMLEALSLERPKPGSIVASPVAIEGRLDFPEPLVFEVERKPAELNQGRFEVSWMAREGGMQVLPLRIIDPKTGISVEPRCEVTVDLSGPRLITPKSNTRHATRDAELVIEGRFDDDVGIAGIESDFGELEDRGGGVFLLRCPLPEDVEQRVRLVARDLAGRRTYGHLRVIRDREKPVLQLAEPAGGVDPGTRPLALRLEAEDLSRLEVTVNGRRMRRLTKGIFVSELQEDEESIEIVATDEAGNEERLALTLETAAEVKEETAAEHEAEAVEEEAPELEPGTEGRDAPEGCTVLDRMPDPAVIGSEAQRKRIIATGLPWRIRHQDSGVEFLLVPAGSYRRGASDGDREAQESEKPAHEVEITKPFYLGRHEITGLQAKQVRPEYQGEDERPLTGVGFKEAMRYCGRFGFRLPTEAEWEFACRAGTSGARYGPVDDVAWHAGNSEGRTGRCGSKSPNPWGFHDMLGNASELCSDVYAPGAYRRLRGRVVDPDGPPRGGSRVLRGGSYKTAARSCRASRRTGRIVGTRVPEAGFRVALTP